MLDCCRRHKIALELAKELDEKTFINAYKFWWAVSKRVLQIQKNASLIAKMHGVSENGWMAQNYIARASLSILKDIIERRGKVL